MALAVVVMSGGDARAGTAVVMGGGLAGIAAALRLAEAGVTVTLIETRRRLGGRATSFEQRDAEQTVDNCQHVLLGCCTNLIDLYERLGVADLIEWHDRLHFFDKAGTHDVMKADGLPAPLHLMRSLRGFGTLSRAEKQAIGRAMWAIMRAGESGREAAAGRSFGDWLREHGQPARAVERFWAVILISALNQTPDRSSAKYAMQVFQDGFLAHRRAWGMGVSSVPLVRLYDAAGGAIESRGGRVMLGCSIDGIEFDGTDVSGVRVGDGSVVRGDAYVSALPFDRLDRVVSDELRAADARLARLDEFEVSPILGIHLWFEGEVTDRAHLVFVDSPLQWAFNKGVDAATGQQYLHGVISAADDWVGEPAEVITAMAMRELAAYVPAAGEAVRLVRSRVIKEKRATFSPSPGVDALRPPPGPPGPAAPPEVPAELAGAAQNSRAEGVGNLYLAGDWCDTGWPATMEGAVRSGYAAAGVVCGESLLIDDLKPGWVYRMLRGR
ncbi:MAG: carotene 7,8-desaturase [Planctomycetaceae bacterium]|nr:carotene 7,8-desaturase [Planctomycetaceae bacterium]